ncbi:MAG: cytidylate kinase family protein [Eubacteriales bacterium]|nr:cytidylate kinase family protein [Eubacteriales bacterium]
MRNKISLAGDLGSGKSTVADILAPRIGAEYYGTGVIAREIAASMGMDIAAFNIFMETHPEQDRAFDDRLIALSDDPRTLIIDSRMAWHFTRETYRVYLTTDPTVAAIRIMQAGRQAEKFSSLEEATARIRARKMSEKKRYFDLYGVDCKNLENYDLVVDTTYATPEEVAEEIERGYRAWQAGENERRRLLCPRRLCYPDTAPDPALVDACHTALELGTPVPTPAVVPLNDAFYLVSGAEVALAYSLLDSTFLPVRLAEAAVEVDRFVKMEDSL